MSHISRILQNSSTQSNQDQDVYQYLQFMAWYFLMVMCCVIPTICAYRRRRLRDLRLLRERRASRATMSTQTVPSTPLGRVTSKKRLAKIQHSLQGTTMVRDGSGLAIQHGCRVIEERYTGGATCDPTDVCSLIALYLVHQTVTGEDLIKGEGVPSGERIAVSAVDGDVETGNDDRYTNAASSVGGSQDVLFDDDVSDLYEHAWLQLPDDGSNASRRVAAACAVCLGPYQTGDTVAWSSRRECQHAYHRECIEQWLARKNDPLCPCCRQEFCDGLKSSKRDDRENSNEGDTTVLQETAPISRPMDGVDDVVDAEESIGP